MRFRIVNRFAFVLFGFVVANPAVGQMTLPRDYAVEASATVQSSPPRISIRWPADARALSYRVFRKRLHDGSWQELTGLPGNATAFDDPNVAPGEAYEYGFSKQTNRGLTGYGYLYAGINAPLIEGRGKLILVVDASVAGPLSAELDRLQQDLTGDGWVVLRQTVPRDASPPQVKGVIKSAYDSDRQNVNAALLLGHVPVAYSGNIAPDGHENHRGAWPADVYYAELDGAWTDSTVNTTSSERRVN